jgi:hypothetical protein
MNFMTKQKADDKLTRLQWTLSDFDVELHFRSGERDGAADALSRLCTGEGENVLIDDHLPRDPAAGGEIELHALNAIPNRDLADRILTIAAVTTRSGRQRGPMVWRRKRRSVMNLRGRAWRTLKRSRM